MNRFEQFLGSEWARLLAPFLLSTRYKELSLKIKHDKSLGYKITPNLQDIYRCFSQCPIEKMHTIIMTNEPYNTIAYYGYPTADGLAFSSIDSLSCPKELNYIYEAIDSSVYNSEGYHLTESFDLTKWSNQGILLLNCALTSVIGKENAHIEIWRPFMEYLLAKINDRKLDLGIIMVGEIPKTYSKILNNPSFEIIEVDSIKEAIKYNRSWQYKNCFNRINEFHSKHNIKINW